VRSEYPPFPLHKYPSGELTFFRDQFCSSMDPRMVKAAKLIPEVGRLRSACASPTMTGRSVLNLAQSPLVRSPDRSQKGRCPAFTRSRSGCG
jgi:hypothetical protein